MRNVDVAIVGAGPAGLVLALLLARSGCKVEVVEQQSSFEREYRGEGIQPGTLRIFADLGLEDAIRRLDCGAPQGVRARVDGHTFEAEFARFVGADSRGRAAFIPQPLLLEILAGAARAASATISLATPFKALRYEGHRVCGIDIIESDGEPGAIAARLVVGCDGRFSAVRRAAGVAVRASRLGYDLVWFSASAPTDANDLVYVNVTGPHIAIAFPSRRHLMQTGWLIPKGSFAALQAVPFEQLARMLVARAPAEAAPALQSELRSVQSLALLPIASERVARWSTPGLLLLGDAAHPMSPVAAQGINVAVQDAVVAARHLASAEEPNALDRALAQIERERAPAIRRIARQQNALLAAFERFGPGRFLRVAMASALFVERLGLFRIIAGPFLDRFLWGDPPVRADAGPWHAREGLMHE